MTAPAISAALCPLCGGGCGAPLRGVADPLTGERFEVQRCEGCGLGRTIPMPDDLGRYYAEYHGGRHGATAEMCLRRRLGFLSTFGARGGRLLDVGCGDGSFLLAARAKGWQVTGTEFHPEPARERGLGVAGSLDELAAGEGFDCITCWHSLEHLRDPLEAVRQLRGLLRPEGLLLIAVPDFGGLQAACFGRHWLHLDVPRHLFHFTRSALGRLLDATGFAPVGWRHCEFEYDLMGWSQSAMNCLASPPNAFFHLLTGKAKAMSAAAQSLHLLGGAALTGLALPMLAVEALLGRGGTLVVAARPER